MADSGWAGDLTPITDADWDRAKAAHLLERAGFGGTPAEIDAFASLSPQQAVRYLVRFEGAPPVELPPRPETHFDVEDFVRRNYHEVWNRRMLNLIRRDYAEGFACYTSGGRKLVGHSDITQFDLSMLGMFPDGEMTVEEVYWNGNEHEGFRAAVRWTFAGTHRGPGVYGEPSGARVCVMGLSQHRIRNGKFVEEHTLFDEFGLIKQIMAHRLAGG